jgi:geranylgeranyl pyrophosphate synthase/phage shock protein PspC (stress-responsive transcriptional regulator)
MTMATSRDLEHGVVAGVCAGIASRYRYPVTRVRAATVVLSVATAGLGGLAYLALWRILPPAAQEALPSPDGATAPESQTIDAQHDAMNGHGHSHGQVSDRSNGHAAPSSHAAAVAPTSDTANTPDAGTSEADASEVPTAAKVSGGAVAPSLESLYGPVASDLPLVRETIGEVARGVGFDFLERMLQQQLAGTGKMMRPAMALLAGRLGDYNLERVVPLAASVELLHSATLVHDDVIDEADKRRGNETANALFGNSASVMLGDYMFANSAELIARTDNIQVVQNFAATLMMIVRGELNQDVTVFEYSEDVQRYLDRIIGKTASLFATAAENGALVCNAPADQVAAMREYGMKLGIAFQIVDDVLDFTGDPEVMGKPVGSDLRGGTLTLPAILYMQRVTEDNPIKRAFDGQRRNANLDRAIAEILAGDYIAESVATAERFGREALGALEALPSGETRETLSGLVEYVLAREM